MRTDRATRMDALGCVVRTRDALATMRRNGVILDAAELRAIDADLHVVESLLWELHDHAERRR